MISIGLPAIGAAAVGIASAALDTAMEYVKQRTIVPSQTLANFDGVQCTIADMVGKVEASRLLVYQAGSVDEQPPDPILGLTASIVACEAAVEVTGNALQLFGALGYTTDFAVERYFRDAKGLTIIGQPIELRKLMAGKLKLGLPPMGPSPGPPADTTAKLGGA